jgi:glutaredoxin
MHHDSQHQLVLASSRSANPLGPHPSTPLGLAHALKQVFHRVQVIAISHHLPGPNLLLLTAPAYTPSQQAKGQFSQLRASRALAHEHVASDSTQWPPTTSMLASAATAHVCSPSPHPLSHTQAKGLFSQLSVPAKVIECDVTQGGDKIREGLTEVTGRRTVPQVFIGGKHVGGCDGASHSCWHCCYGIMSQRPFAAAN